MEKQDETYHLQCDYQMYESLIIQQALIVCLVEDMTTVWDFKRRKAAISSLTEKIGGLQIMVATEETDDYHGGLIITV